MRIVNLMIGALLGLLVAVGFAVMASRGNCYNPEKMTTMLWVISGGFHLCMTLIGIVIADKASEEGI
jgi:hypothetical protein